MPNERFSPADSHINRGSSDRPNHLVDRSDFENFKTITRSTGSGAASTALERERILPQLTIAPSSIHPHKNLDQCPSSDREKNGSKLDDKVQVQPKDKNETPNMKTDFKPRHDGGHGGGHKESDRPSRDDDYWKKRVRFKGEE